MESTDVTEKLRLDFLQLLRSRHSSQAPLLVVPGKSVAEPLYQEKPPPTKSEAKVMESCPKVHIPNLKDQLKEENFYLITEPGEQGCVPLLILSLKECKQQRRPAIVFLHRTNTCKEWLRPLLEVGAQNWKSTSMLVFGTMMFSITLDVFRHTNQFGEILLKAYASRGYVAVAIDSRYHGERASNINTYQDALVSSWKQGDTMPFIFDTVWDLIQLADYLSTREDIDPSKIGVTGESLGGMHAWVAAFAEPRYAVVVPIIGLQGFRWAIDNDKWQPRVNSIKAVFEEARIDLGKSEIDKEVVEKVWDKIAPGLTSHFDAPHTVPAISPRPLLILNGEKDRRCPIEGLQVPISRTCKAYEEANAPHNFKLVAQPGIWHRMTSEMVKEASDWFDKFLK